MEERFPKLFPKCPVCGSENRLAGYLAGEEKEKGRIREELEFYAYSIEGLILDKAREPMIPFGSGVPSYNIHLDVCLDCGCIWANRIDVGEAKKTPTPISPKGRQPPPFSLS